MAAIREPNEGQNPERSGTVPGEFFIPRLRRMVEIRDASGALLKEADKPRYKLLTRSIYSTVEDMKAVGLGAEARKMIAIEPDARN